MQYQVALSFAGEQRDYVEKVAKTLQARGIALFYDGFEKIRLWGKDLTEELEEIFARQASLVVIFTSKEYAEKSWTRYEASSALSRAVQEGRECVLPVRCDDTPLPELLENVAFERTADHEPADLAVMIAEKLGIGRFEGKANQVPPPRMISLTGEVSFDYSSYDGHYVIGSGNLEFEIKWTKASNTCIHVYNDPESINGVALAREFISNGQVKDARSLDYTSRTRSPCLRQIVVLRNVYGFYAAVQVLEIKDDKRGDDRDEVRFRYAIQSNDSDSFAEFEGI